MPGFILTVAGWFGINPLRLIAYAGIFLLVTGGAFTIRQHYINLGWEKHKVKVEQQDQRAVDASKQVQRKADECSANGWWDVISQSCKLEEDK